MLTALMPRPTRRQETSGGVYLYLVIALLVASSNLGLVNNVLAIKTGAGENLVGMRDILVGCLIVLGLRARGRFKTIENGALAGVIRIILWMTPLAALVGLISGGEPLSVAREFVMMLSWSLAIIVARRLQTPKQLRLVVNAFVVVALCLSIGVFVEAVTAMRLRVVTPTATDGVRSTPSGWPIMMIGESLLFVHLLLETRTSAVTYALRGTAWLAIAVASLLTQSRTLVVGVLGSSLVFLLVGATKALGRIRFSRLAFICALSVGAVSFNMALGARFIRADFAKYYTTRYSVIGSLDSAVEYSNVDGRLEEAELAVPTILRSPILGVGLAAPNRELIDENDRGILVHNVYVHFATRYGIPGMLAFLTFEFLIFLALLRAVRDRSDLSPVGVGLAVALINVMFCAWFGNVFGTPYGTPPVMISVACLIAYERLANSRTRTVQGGGAFLLATRCWRLRRPVTRGQ